MSDSDDSGAFGPFGLPLPAELVQRIQNQHEQMHMSAEAEAARVERFIASLDVDSLLALRHILNTGDMRDSKSANFIDGQLVAILRHVKHVDPASGEPNMPTVDEPLPPQ